ncbi:hypothetical protein KXV85_001258, partial [Aspergillus fumigatus]
MVIVDPGLRQRAQPGMPKERDRTMPKLSDATRTKFKGISTATVATALFKRGLRIQMIQD